jgi:hypothetical protein
MPTSRDTTFKRVTIDYAVKGVARVAWELDPHFLDPEPHTFQLQVSQAGVAGADWEDVGTEVVNAFYATDDEQRLHGKNLTVHYRVTLETPNGSYISRPQPAYGLLGKHDWLIGREIIRKFQLHGRKFVDRDGYLFKVKRYGTPCTRENCLDPLTGESTDSDCPICLGTGFTNGYYDPVPFQITGQLEERYEDEAVEPGGTANALEQLPFAIAYPQINHKDVWVESGSDRRFYLHRVQHRAEYRGVPLIVAIEARQAPFTDVAYDLEVP